jgi:hypothetical protein
MDEVREAEDPHFGFCSSTTKADDEGGKVGLIVGDATPPLRLLPPLLPPEKSSNEEECKDGPDLARKIQPPTPRLHMGRWQNSKT